MRSTTIRTTRLIFSSLSCLAMFYIFIVILCNFKSLPPQIEIHFDGHGQCDLTGSKLYVLSYFPIEIATIVLFEVFQRLVSVLPVKKDIFQDVAVAMRLITTAFIGLIELDICVFIAVTGCCITTKTILNTMTAAGCAFVLLFGIVAVAIAIIYTQLVYRNKK